MAHKNERVDSYEAGEASLIAFANTKSGMAYGFMTKAIIDGEVHYTVHKRWNQPCYGEMRPYGSAEPELLPEKQRSVEKPGDLHSPFPKVGNPILVVYCLPMEYTEKSLDGIEAYLSLYMSPESPWRMWTKDAEVLRNSSGIPRGIIYRNTHLPPTPLIEGWMFFRNKAGSLKVLPELIEKNPDAKPGEILLFFAGFNHWFGSKSINYSWPTYCLSPVVDAQRFLNGLPITEEPTFYERAAYDRPTLHNVFGITGKNLLREFSNLGGKSVSDITDVQKDFELFRKAIAA